MHPKIVHVLQDRFFKIGLGLPGGGADHQEFLINMIGSCVMLVKNETESEIMDEVYIMIMDTVLCVWGGA